MDGRRSMASDPNTPAERLGLLGADFPAELLSNPALDLLRLAHPQLPHAWPARTVARLATHPQTPREVLARLLSDPDYGVRLAVARRPGLEAPFRARLENDLHPLVRLAARRPGLTG